jgi:hypothetical protein
VDCGAGYESFLAGLRNPTNEQHADMLSWTNRVFDPMGFDLNRSNRDCRGAKRNRR